MTAVLLKKNFSYSKFSFMNKKHFQGTAFDSRYPFIIMCGLFFVATVCSSFLPETLYQKLPDSIEEARMFGANQVSTRAFLHTYL